MKSDFQIQAGRLIVRTAQNESEMTRAIALRSRAFRPGTAGLSDYDPFDDDSDHILVIDPKTDQLLGNYRVRTTAKNTVFYSETEFDLSAFDFLFPGSKMEMGRACVEPAIQNTPLAGMVLLALWKGIRHYAGTQSIDYVFGCSSFFRSEFGSLSHLLQDHPLLHPRAFRAINPVQESWWENNAQGANIPPLLRFYLKSGAVLLGEPAYDADFDCIDVLTLLRLDQLSQSTQKKTTACQNPASISY